MSWFSQLPQPVYEHANNLVAQLSDVYATHSFWKVALLILLPLWTVHIISQLVKLFFLFLRLMPVVASGSYPAPCCVPLVSLDWKHGHLRHGALQIFYQLSQEGTCLSGLKLILVRRCLHFHPWGSQNARCSRSKRE